MLPLTMRKASGQRPQGKLVKNQALLAWGCICTIYVVSSARRLGSVELSVLWMFWQPVVPPLLMLYLWGAAVRRFTQLSVDYEQCFATKDRKYLLEGTEIQKFAAILFGVATTTASVYCLTASRQLFFTAEFMPLLLYCGLAGVALMPVAALHRPTRHFFAHTCTRVLLPLQEVSWADFLLADIFCSLSKSSADVTSALCHSATGPVMQSLIHSRYMPPQLCNPQSPLMLAAPCLPYAIRFVQCLIVNRTTGSTTQLFNAAKYMSSFPALVLTALEHDAHMRGQPFPQRRLWLAVMALNTAYSFYWDVEQDWDMPWIVAASRRRAAHGVAGELMAGGLAPQVGSGQRRLKGWLPSLRPNPLYPPWWYSWALCSNLVLRCAWMHRLIGSLENSKRLALVLACLEAWRRYQWSFIRVETELRKIAARSASVMSLDSLPTSGSSGYLPTAQAITQPDSWDKTSPPVKAAPQDPTGSRAQGIKGIEYGGTQAVPEIALYATTHGSTMGGSSPSGIMAAGGSSMLHRVLTASSNGGGGGQESPGFVLGAHPGTFKPGGVS